MSVNIQVPTVLRPFVDGQRTVSVPGEAPLDALRKLAEEYPDVSTHLFDQDGKLRSFINVFLNDENIRDLPGDITITAGDELRIVPAVAGGSQANGLSPEELKRYNRHIIMPEVGVDGQKRLRAASVLLIGTGGLGSPLAVYLAAAGVGRLGLVDFDRVDFSNLQRQIIHFTPDVGRPKLESAKDKILAINPNVKVDLYETRLTSENAMEILADYDIIIDGTDNFPTRYLVNDACVLLGKPNVYGSIFRFEGQASVFDATQGPCYRCLYPEPPPPGLVPSCAEGGVLGILPGTIGAIQATEGIKQILGIGESLVGRLMLFDALHMSFREVKVRKDPNCPICGEQPTIKGLIDYEEFCGIPKEEEEELVVPEITPRQLAERRDELFLVDVREPHEVDIAKIDGAHLIPLREVSSRFGELDPDKEIVVHCRSGKRSAAAVHFLMGQGFNNIHNLRGGILAWSDEVDPAIAKY